MNLTLKDIKRLLDDYIITNDKGINIVDVADDLIKTNKTNRFKKVYFVNFTDAFLWRTRKEYI